MDQLRKITLETVGGGAAVELFEHEWRRLLANIQDPNTDPEKQRKVTLTVAVSPGEDREHGEVAVSVKSKLAPPKPHTSPLYLGEEDGELVAVGYDPRQNDLFADDEETEGVVPLTRDEKEV